MAWHWKPAISFIGSEDGVFFSSAAITNVKLYTHFFAFVERFQTNDYWNKIY